MKELRKYPVIIFFAALLYVISIADLFSPVREQSDLENRKLRQFPAFSMNELVNNEYTPKIERFTEDQFIMRDRWISLKSVGESLLGKKENNGVVYGKDGYLFTKFLTADYEQYQKNLDALARFIERHPERHILFMPVPTAPGVMTDKVLPGSPVIDTDGVLALAEENIPADSLIDVRPLLEERTDEYIYYRTDHHWTTRGAYSGYAALMDRCSREARPMSDFTFEGVSPFYGTHYSKSKNFNAVPDTLSYVVTDATMDLKGEEVSIYDTEKLGTRDKYAMFLWGNNDLITVHGSGEGSILVIKDSYANCLIPYLAEDFERIDVADLRYLTTGIDTLMAQNGYDHVVFLYNCESILTDNNIPKINFFF